MERRSQISAVEEATGGDGAEQDGNREATVREAGVQARGAMAERVNGVRGGFVQCNSRHGGGRVCECAFESFGVEADNKGAAGDN